MTEPEKVLPVATIFAIEQGKITLTVEIDGRDVETVFKTTDKVDAFVSKYPKTYHKGTVVEFSAHGGIISLIRQAKGFSKAAQYQPENPPQQAINKIVPLEATAQTTSTFISPIATPENPIQTITITTPQIPLAMSDQTVNIKEIGSFDSSKIKGYEITDTCQVTQFEPISIKVICDNPEEGRKALIEAWGIFGQYTEVTRDIVNNHIKSHLLRDIRV